MGVERGEGGWGERMKRLEGREGDGSIFEDQGCNADFSVDVSVTVVVCVCLLSAFLAFPRMGVFLK